MTPQEEDALAGTGDVTNEEIDGIVRERERKEA
jgi:hypothetical protein